MTQEVRFNPRISAAIRDRNLSVLKQILAEEPAQIHAITPFAAGTWLHFAAREGDIDSLKLLLFLGLNVNVGDAREGRAAICDASLGGHEQVVRFLLESGAVMDTSDSVRNPLFSAIVGRSLPIARLLLSRGIDSEVRYSGSSMKEMDAVAFALERGELAIAEEISRWNAKGDEEKFARIMQDGLRIAKMNN